MRTIAVLNQKGGVGKTTTVANIAAALASRGSRVVTIDLDPQAHLTIHLGLEPQTVEAGSYRVLTQSAGFEEEILLSRLNLWLLPANIDLVGAETELVSVVGREIILREALADVQDKFDFCFIDCPPSLGLLTLNALAAAEEVLIPLEPHFLALQGLGKLLQTVELVNKRINPKLKVTGILLCMFDTRASLPNEVRADIEQFLEKARGTDCAWSEAHVLPTFIRRNIKLAEAPSYGKTIFEYEQDCHGAEDYMKVAEFIHLRGRRVAGDIVASAGSGEVLDYQDRPEARRQESENADTSAAEAHDGLSASGRSGPEAMDEGDDGARHWGESARPAAYAEPAREGDSQAFPREPHEQTGAGDTAQEPIDQERGKAPIEIRSIRHRDSSDSPSQPPQAIPEAGRAESQANQ